MLSLIKCQRFITVYNRAPVLAWLDRQTLAVALYGWEGTAIMK